MQIQYSNAVKTNKVDFILIKESNQNKRLYTTIYRKKVKNIMKFNKNISLDKKQRIESILFRIRWISYKVF